MSGSFTSTRIRLKRSDTCRNLESQAVYSSKTIYNELILIVILTEPSVQSLEKKSSIKKYYFNFSSLMIEHAVYKLSLAMMKYIYSHSDEIQKINRKIKISHLTFVPSTSNFIISLIPELKGLKL